MKTAIRKTARLGVCSLLLALGGPGLQAAESAAATVLTSADVARLRNVASVAVSPEGTHLAFTRLAPRDLATDDDGGAWSELWVKGLADGRERPFVTGKVGVGAVAWTADGSHIAFLAKRHEDQTRSLYLIPVDGGEARRAVSLATDIAAFSLAPDGRRVAVVAAEAEPKQRKADRDKGFSQEIYEEDERPARVWVTSLFAPLPPEAPLPVEGCIHQVEWNPREDRLAVSVTPTAAVDDTYVRQRVRIVDATTGEVLVRVENPGKLGRIGWSRFGYHLAMIAAEDQHDPSAGRLMLVNAGTGAFRDLIPGYEGQVEDFVWTEPDTLVCLASEGVQTVVERLVLQGEETRRERLLGPNGPVLTALAQGGRGRVLAAVGSTPWHPSEVFSWTTDQPHLQRRTDSNPWLAQKRFGVQEVVRHAARDGLELEGVLIRPLADGPGPADPAPLILTVHGGPESHVQNGWNTSYSRPGQVAAARGFAVFYPNYRGSTGRGVAFSKLGQGDAAGREFDDLVDAVDHLVAKGVADPKRVGVTGGSYGGYATAWCSTKFSDRFAAGVMFVGISDKVSKVGTTDIPDEEYLVHALERPWEDWQFLLERSPIYHAGNAHTPLLILHGKDDPRVNVGQSRELYRHLKLRGRAPVRLVLYPGEGHGNRRAASRHDYQLRMLRWFEHYLKGPGGEAPARDLDYGIEANDKP
ncbi:MAG: S9 family peptidase [Verrucomicrobiales bacterium]|nr:S9 family peptidase [Verrucomicrobiales bacterium]